MKATGIVRRIDDLGRVVIPKEIRRKLRIREGDPLEIYVDVGGEIVLKKYSPIGEIGDFAQAYVDSLAESSGHIAMITDQDQVVAVAGTPVDRWIGQYIGNDIERAIVGRRSIVLPFTDRRRDLSDDDDGGLDEKWQFPSWVVSPIIVGGDPVGTVILATDREDVDMDTLEIKLVETAAGFIARQMQA